MQINTVYFSYYKGFKLHAIVFTLKLFIPSLTSGDLGGDVEGGESDLCGSQKHSKHTNTNDSAALLSYRAVTTAVPLTHTNRLHVRH